MLLLLLPVETWREHILQYLSLTEIVRASSACVGCRADLQFRSLTNGLTLEPFFHVANGQADKLRWCLTRNIFPCKLSVSGELDTETASLLPQLCARVTCASFVSSPQNFDRANYARLTSLEFIDCSVINLGSLSECPNLTTLLLDACPKLTTESLLNSLIGCNTLNDCTIENCELINQRAISHILNGSSNLHSIQFGGTPHQHFSLSAILENCSKSARMQTVVTLCCSVCSSGLRRLATLFPQLRKLYLSDPTSNVSDVDIDVLCQKCLSLTDLGLNQFVRLTNAALECITRHLPLLQHLSVANCHGVSNEGLIRVAKGCAELVGLDISNCTTVTDEAVQAVWNHCMLLRDLDVEGCEQIIDAAFPPRVSDTLRVLNVSRTQVRGAFFTQVPTLVRLHCLRCTSLSDIFVGCVVSRPNYVQLLWLGETQLTVTDMLVLSTNLPYLERVRLSRSKANDAVVHSFVANCPKLRFMSLFSCEAVTRATVDELNRVYKHRLSISY